MDVFLFPLVNVTLFPRTTKPLNIFEPRYLDMVRRAVETETPIALGFIEDPSQVSPVTEGSPVPFIRPVAGYGRVKIIEERINGTMLIFLEGIGKCRLGKVTQSQPFIACEAEPIQENTQVSDDLLPRIQGLNRVLARWITTHLHEPEQRDLFMRNLVGPEEIVGAFAAYLVRDYDLQQVVLEYDSLREKVVFLHRLIESNEITA